MSEKILQALMQLFAIGASLERLTLQSREIVGVFLRQQVSLQRIEEYLLLFDQYTDKYTGSGIDTTKARKKIAFSSVRALRICNEINKELNTKQKYIVFLRLVEFMHSSVYEITDHENEFLDTVASAFNIDSETYHLSQLLVVKKTRFAEFDCKNILIVSSEKNPSYNKAHHLFYEDLDGFMIFLHVKESGIFFLLYRGLDYFTANGQPVDSSRITVITQGAVLRCSRLKTLYYRDLILPFLAIGREESFMFTAKNIDYFFNNKKQGLHNINFSVQSGNLTGIMGSSGSGKSTLLNVLNGSYRPTSGQVLINGKDIYEESIGQGMIGNIPQDDLLIEELTVYQNLFYNTKLCFGNLDDFEIDSKVYDVLDSLGLSEIKDLKVGTVLNKSISGGQRKRLNIGLELVREPSILFVDEPTSGLSSRDAENVMDLLKQLALSGKLIFVVIHQPSSDIFRLFDQLFMLDTGGYPIYYGNPTDALIYFKRMVHLTDAEQSECSVCGNINPEQLFNIIELHEVDEFGKSGNTRRITPKEWYQLYQQDKNEVNEIINKHLRTKPSTKANKFNQWKIFLTRDLLSRLSNRQYLLINLLEAPVLALILGFILKYSSSTPYALNSNPNLPAYIFIAVIVSLFIGLSVSAEEIIRDKKIRQREKFLHLSNTSYLMSKVCLLFLISAIQTFCFVVLGNAVMGIYEMNFTYWIVLFSTSCLANLIGLNISSALNSPVTVYILIPFLLIPQILLSGVIVRYDKLHPLISTDEGVPLIGNVMASRWAYEALAVEQFASNPFEKNFYELDAKMSEATYKKDWWIPALKEKTGKIERALNEHLNFDTMDSPMLFLQNEIRKEENFENSTKTKLISQLNAKSIDLNEVATVNQELDKLKNLYIDQYNSSSDKKEKIITNLTSSREKESFFSYMKNKFENESLEEMVKNSNQSERIIIKEDRIIRRFEPVYYSSSERFTKAPMFSYTKNIFGHKIKSLYFNLLIIWSMTILFYVTLRTDLFKKIIDLFSKEK